MNIKRDIPKNIYLTYKTKNIPNRILERWRLLNPNYKIEISDDKDCYEFIEKHFGLFLAELFKKIPIGMYKADLWRLCKLYINGGIYADVDLVPYTSINNILNKYSNNTFITCLSAYNNSCFQAILISTAYNPILIECIKLLVNNKSWNNENGPTYDMYKVLSNSLSNIKLQSSINYSLKNYRIIYNTEFNKNKLNRIYLYAPINNDIINNIIIMNFNKSDFNLVIKDNYLFIKYIKKDNKLINNIKIIIEFNYKNNIYLFKEKNKIYGGNDILDFYVDDRGSKLFDSRDENYHISKSNNLYWN